MHAGREAVPAMSWAPYSYILSHQLHQLLKLPVHVQATYLRHKGRSSKIYTCVWGMVKESILGRFEGSIFEQKRWTS